MDRLSTDIRYVPTPATSEFMTGIEAGDWPAALQVLDENCMELWYGLDPTDLCRLLDEAPESLLTGLANTAFLAEVAWHGTPVEGGDPSPELPEGAANPEQVAKVVADPRLRGRPAEAMTHLQKAAPSVEALRCRLVDGSGGRATLRRPGGCTALLAGNLAAARGMLLAATSARRADRFPFVARDAMAKLALAHAVSGSVTEATHWSGLVRTLIPSDSWVESMVDDTLWLTEYLCASTPSSSTGLRSYARKGPRRWSTWSSGGVALQAQVRHLVLTRRPGRPPPSTRR